MIKTIQDFLQKVLGIILSILPDSPFAPVIAELEQVPWLGYLNWFIPVGTLVGIGTAWTAAIAVFYTYQIILRWAKAVGD